MTRLVLIALALVLVFNLAASQSLWVETCSASACGTSCLNCSTFTWINNTNATNPVVLCPQNGTFCFVDNYWSNGTWSVQNCSGCANSSNTSCTNCTAVMNSFEQDFCSTNGTCWSINFNNTATTNISISQNTTSVNGSNTTTTTISTSNCNCTNATTGVTGNTGINNKGQFCMCPAITANTTSNPNGTVTTTVTSQKFNESVSVAAFGTTLQVCLAAVTAILVSALLV